MASGEELKRFFFRASTLRQNNELKKIHIARLPGSNLRIYREEDLRYSHLQFRGEISGWGNMFIHEGKILRWYLDSRGTCKSMAAVDFLALALLEAYTKGEFFAGRGPLRFTSSAFPGFEYVNELEMNEFDNFACVEKLYKDGKDQGIHRVSGGIV